ncbi:MAG: hypothetical protein IJN38_00745 [Clostridia bacterium]|nr:hypothetical protein [Clostridia bacterium]
MKSKFKKLLSVLLVCALLAASLSVQSLAAFEDLKAPVITEIKLNKSSQAVSLKEVDDYFTDVIETLEEYDIDLGSLSEEELSIYLGLINYNLYFSAFEYELDVTLSTGKTYTVSAEEGEIVLNRIYSIETDCYINYSAYLEAKEKGADEIEIILCASPYNKLTNNYCYDLEYTTTDEWTLVDMYIKSITPLSDVPAKIYADIDYCDIDGAEFLIEYADCTTDTAKALRNTAAQANPYDSMEDYTLAGKPLYAWYYKDYGEEEEVTAEYVFTYLDAVYTQSVEVDEESLIEYIEITDCIIDSKTAQLNSMKYEITYADGDIKSFTKEFDEAENEMLYYGVNINAFDGYIVCVDFSIDNGDMDMETMNADNFYITASVGEHSDTFVAENPHKDITNAALKIIIFFVNAFMSIGTFFTDIFNAIFFF